MFKLCICRTSSKLDIMILLVKNICSSGAQGFWYSNYFGIVFSVFNAYPPQKHNFKFSRYLNLQKRRVILPYMKYSIFYIVKN